jgi:hypothetical protein
VRDAPNDFRDGPPVILTWLIHDVMVWRVDQVYVHDGTTYVLTQENVGGGPLSEGTSVLHEAGPGLVRLLDQVLPTGDGYLLETPVDTDPAPAAQAEPVVAAEVAAPVEATSPLLVTRAVLGGMVLGVLGTLAAFAVRRPRGGADERFVCDSPA